MNKKEGQEQEGELGIRTRRGKTARRIRHNKNKESKKED